MNYYERHLGDYARDTAHLTMLEHGAYTLLLDRYYTTEDGIPIDQVHRLARARTDDERAAVDSVLSEFFVQLDGKWINRRAEEEIARFKIRTNASSENGKLGGRPRKNQNLEKTPRLFLGSENETQQKAKQNLAESQTKANRNLAESPPDTIHHTPYTSKETHKEKNQKPENQNPSSICMAMKAAGIGSVNPGHPDLIALINQGAKPDDFVHAAASAIEKGKGFAYAIGIVKSRLAETASTASTKKGTKKNEHNRHSVIEPA